MKLSQRLVGLLFAAIIGIAIGLFLYNNSFDDATVTNQDFAGTWSCVIEDESMGTTMLTNAGFNDDELALVQDKAFRYVVIAEFDVDGNYSLAFDYDVTAQNVKQLFTAAFDDLCEGRANLNETYAQDFAAMSEEEFRQFCAELRDQPDFETLLTEVTAYEFSGVSVYDSGTYKIKNSEQINMGSSGAARYSFTDSGLTLKFSDVTMNLTRCD